MNLAQQRRSGTSTESTAAGRQTETWLIHPSTTAVTAHRKITEMFYCCQVYTYSLWNQVIVQYFIAATVNQHTHTSIMIQLSIPMISLQGH